MLNHTSSASWPGFNSPACPASVLAGIGRVLLILTSVSLMTMPVTERLWTWDHFLHGGQDFELGALLVLSILCLALVLPRYGKQFVDSLFANWCHLAFIFKHRQLVRTPLLRAFSILLAERVPSPALAVYSLPLQI
jgi:hypothetical protein